MLRRHSAITRGNVFAKQCAQGLSVAELKEALKNKDDRVLRKLLYFAAPIPATRQYMRHMGDKAISYLKWLRIDSLDEKMFNFFQTFSAADLHFDDLHKILPGHEKYLGKRVVENN